MNVGVLSVYRDANIDPVIAHIKEMGFNECQLTCWVPSLYTEENARLINEACAKYGVKITTLWCGYSGHISWNFYEAQRCLGLIPAAYRAKRLAELKAGSDFAKLLGVDNIATHVGFMPEDPTSELYQDVIIALKELCEYVKENGQDFLFETGQETPVTLLRAIDDIGTGNVGINLDPANLILYGKANPVDALDVIGKYIRNVHAKDGMYPTNGRDLGQEVPIGEGKVNFPALIAGLKALGYDGPITIEREISGEQQTKDILKSKKYLEELINA